MYVCVCVHELVLLLVFLAGPDHLIANNLLGMFTNTAEKKLPNYSIIPSQCRLCYFKLTFPI